MSLQTAKEERFICEMVSCNHKFLAKLYYYNCYIITTTGTIFYFCLITGPLFGTDLVQVRLCPQGRIYSNC